jgi:hypothetical protein
MEQEKTTLPLLSTVLKNTNECQCNDISRTNNTIRKDAMERDTVRQLTMPQTSVSYVRCDNLNKYFTYSISFEKLFSFFF